jgi:hypothetical protein
MFQHIVDVACVAAVVESTGTSIVAFGFEEEGIFVPMNGGQ